MAMAATLPTPTTADARAKPNHPDPHAAFRPHPAPRGCLMQQHADRHSSLSN
jgi:hypothetical protein